VALAASKKLSGKDAYCFFTCFPTDGIGTTAPADQLNVTKSGGVGGIQVDNTYEPGLLLNATGTGGKRWDMLSSSGTSPLGTGKLVFYNRTDNFAAMSITSTGNVGIGTTAPVTKLHSVSTGNTSVASAFIYGDYYGPTVGVNSTSSSNYALRVVSNVTSAGNGGNSLLYVRADGNVGIGTTVPSDLLHIKDGNLRLDYYATGTMPRSAGTINFYDRGFPLAVIQAVEEGPNYGYQSGLSFYTNPGSGDGSTMAERVRISKSGNVGIGSTAPTQALDVNGTVRAAHVSITGSSCSWSGWACSPTCAAGYYQAGTMMGAANNCNGTGPNVQIYCCSF